MKHKQYRNGNLRVSKSWPAQVLGLVLMAFALGYYKAGHSFTIVQFCSLTATYVLGVGMVVYPLFNKKYIGRSLFICGIAIVVAASIACVVLAANSHLFSTPHVTKPTLN